MSNATCNPSVEVWISRLRKYTSIILLRLLLSSLCSYCLLLASMPQLVLLSPVNQNNKRSCQHDDDQAFQDPIFDNIIVKAICISSGHRVVVWKICIVVTSIIIIKIVILKEVADPFA
jgi:hypothetical protein